MNYYIQGNKDNADQIRAAFERLGFDVTGFDMRNDNILFFTYKLQAGANVISTTSANLYIADIIKTHPDYKELELPVEPKFKVGDKVIYKGNVCTITFMDEVYYDFDGGVAGCRIEKQDELLSAAPKFKIGDWIACDADSFTLSIKSVRDENYYFHQGESLPIKYIDEHYHLWSIADAKDGDIIGFNDYTHNDGSYIDWVGIYRRQGNDFINDFINHQHLFHCVATSKNTFRIGGSWRVFTAYPATKEQRDLLFKKMKEAGYQWDEEKKELRKIQPHYDISNFKPFQKVLVRDGDDTKWRCNWFSHYSGDGGVYRFVTTKCGYAQCIPFEGNEHLLGTTYMCDEQYINW